MVTPTSCCLIACAIKCFIWNDYLSLSPTRSSHAPSLPAVEAPPTPSPPHSPSTEHHQVWQALITQGSPPEPPSSHRRYPVGLPLPRSPCSALRLPCGECHGWVCGAGEVEGSTPGLRGKEQWLPRDWLPGLLQ